MTQQEHLTHQVYLVDLYLKILQYCNDKEFDQIMMEIREVRKSIVFVEEMTRTEKQLPIKQVTFIMESKL